MNSLQSQNQAQVEKDGFDQAKSNDGFGKDVLSLTPESLSPNFCSSELRTLHDETEVSNVQDPEKGAMKLTGKYAKYAGEPPDGGLKAWSVILACVDYRVQCVPGTDSDDRGSCMQDRFDNVFGVGGFWFLLHFVQLSWCFFCCIGLGMLTRGG